MPAGLRVAYVCADRGVPIFGWKGASVHVQEVVRAFRGVGACVEVFGVALGSEPPPDLIDIPVHGVSLPADAAPVDSEDAAVAANQPLADELERHGPFDLVYERYSLWSYAAIEYADSVSVPGVLEVNAPLIDEQARHRVLVNRRAAEEVAERVFGSATLLAAVSREIAAYLDRYSRARGRIHVIPNAVDPCRFAPREPLPVSSAPPPFTVGFVGTLKPWHGVPVLIEAFTRLQALIPTARLVIVGDGPQRASLVQDVEHRGLTPHVQFVGAVPPADVPFYLRSLDVAAAPYPDYSDFYFSPLKVFEYMAAGLPIAASRIGQVNEVLRDNETALLFTPGDATELAAALARLGRDPDLRARLGTAARAVALREHTWQSVVIRVLDLAGVAIA
jgi:glycosyltransferase involved in cell wall biosynthesis